MKYKEKGKSQAIELSRHMLTAKYYNIKVTGTLEPCEDCKLSKARQKNVTKLSEGTATAPGERLCVDISSVRDVSFGGNKFWILVLDDKTDMIWSMFEVQERVG